VATRDGELLGASVMSFIRRADGMERCRPASD